MNYSSDSDEVRESDKRGFSKNRIDIFEITDTNSGSDELDPKKNKIRYFKRLNKKQVTPYIFHNVNYVDVESNSFKLNIEMCSRLSSQNCETLNNTYTGIIAQCNKLGNIELIDGTTFDSHCSTPKSLGSDISTSSNTNITDKLLQKVKEMKDKSTKNHTSDSNSNMLFNMCASSQDGDIISLDILPDEVNEINKLNCTFSLNDSYSNTSGDSLYQN